MSLTRAFLSFDFDHDEASRNLFKGQMATESPTPFSAADWSSKESLPQAQWEAIIEAKIKQCDVMIVLVGAHMSTARGVEKEISFAKRNKIPVFGVYLKGCGELTTLPNGLNRADVVEWKWNEIARKLRAVI